MGSRFFPIHRSDSGLTNASFHKFPGAANLFLFSVCCALYRFERHLTGLELTVELQKLASIRYPTLVPHFSRRVVDAETLTFMAVGILIVLPQNASIELPKAQHGERSGRQRHSSILPRCPPPVPCR
jgi:hypothetical protein